MSMVTLGDCVYNTKLGWLISVKARISNPDGKICYYGSIKFPVLMQEIPESSRFEWTVTPLGFHYSETGLTIVIDNPTEEQQIDLAVATITQWGKHAWTKQLELLKDKVAPSILESCKAIIESKLLNNKNEY